jgi:hypothetical protein
MIKARPVYEAAYRWFIMAATLVSVLALFFQILKYQAFSSATAVDSAILPRVSMTFTI